MKSFCKARFIMVPALSNTTIAPANKLSHLVIVAVVFSFQVIAHEMSAPLVIDTDMALDDARAIILILQDPNCDVRAIVTSDGSTPSEIGVTNVLKILAAMNKANIPVGQGNKLNQPYPVWSAWSRTLGWTELLLPAQINIQPAHVVLSNTIATSSRPVTWVCLGPMSNLAEFLSRYPNLKHMISRVYYYGTPPDTEPKGWNTAQDLEAAKKAFASGIPITCVSLLPQFTLVLTSNFFESLKSINSPGASLILQIHSHPRVKSLVASGHFRAWDDAVVLLMHEPAIALPTHVTTCSNVTMVTGLDTAKASNTYLDILQEGMLNMVLLSRFPSEPEFYKPDVAPYVQQIILRHGVEEWALGVMATEMHGHLGLYSILGVKMGLRAREILGVPRDSIYVETLASTNPPISCLNDGIQFSTGASLGRGTITIHPADKPQPIAIFHAKGKKLILKPKPGPLKEIQDKINKAAALYGTNSPEYFHTLRKISLETWLSLDRKNIFEEQLEFEITNNQNHLN